MAKSEGQKLKLLYLLKILEEYSDEHHFISMQVLLDKLWNYGIEAERKSIYDDIAMLKLYGYDIIQSKRKEHGGYALNSRDFTLPELKLLVDAVQSSKYITVQKSNELIRKLEKLTSTYTSKELHRQVYVSDRIKTDNEGMYDNVDLLHKAMQTNNQIKFRYIQYATQKKTVYKKKGAFYEISPYYLSVQEDHYYLIAYDLVDGIIKHYRVDKMTEVALVPQKRAGQELFSSFDIVSYSQKSFGMFQGEDEVISFTVPSDLIGVMVDRFGKECAIRPINNEFVRIRGAVSVSPTFYGWLTSVGARIQITSPIRIKEEYEAHLTTIINAYKARKEEP